jgi:hypothetical protein
MGAGFLEEQAIYASRLMGMRVEEIARTFRKTEDEVDDIIAAKARRTQAKVVAQPEVVFAIELDRIDEILQGVYPLAREGNKDAVSNYVKLGERRDKLLGLHLDVTRRKFMDPALADDLQDLTDEELRVLENIATRKRGTPGKGG